jgi:hypothetical protein
MPAAGWKQLLSGFPWFQGEGCYPIPAYSEFMPPPRLGRKPYGIFAGIPFDDKDPFCIACWPLQHTRAITRREL